MMKLFMLSGGIFFFAFVHQVVAAGAAAYLIEPVKDDVYRVTAGGYHSVFMVTEDAIVMADPMNRGAAEWLAKEFEERFERPLQYVIYSHSHPDHTYGGEALDAAGVNFISHALTREDMVRNKAQVRLPNMVFEDEFTLYSGSSQVHLRLSRGEQWERFDFHAL